MRTTAKPLLVLCGKRIFCGSWMHGSTSSAWLSLQRRENLNTKLSFHSYQATLKRSFCEIQGNICWNCRKCMKRKDQFFCNDCGSLQDADGNYDYFQLLSLDPNFSINPTDLTTKFRQLQNVLHPDKYSNRPEREQLNSLEWSSLINKAYKTLSIPIDRGEYILKMQGMELPQDNSALNQAFLMEMMEKNEEVEEATKDNVLDLLQRIRSDLEKAAVELENVFDERNFEKAKFVLVRMKYFKSLEKNIKEKAVKLGAVK